MGRLGRRHQGDASHAARRGVRLLPIRLSAAQLRDYYHGFANATLWPLLHDAIEKPRFERARWQSYRQVNAAFADGR